MVFNFEFVFSNKNKNTLTNWFPNLYLALPHADVAKLDKASGYEPEDSRFESWHLH